LGIMIDNLKAFVGVIDGKSLTRAAAKLHLTQSAVSRRIQQLEEDLGAVLLDRRQRPQHATALGRRVYEHALPILRAVEDLLALPREDAAPTGSLRFGVSQAIGDIVLADAAQRLKAQFPTLDLRLRAGWGDGLAAQVAAGELDAAVLLLAAGNLPAAPLLGRAIGAIDVAVVQSKRHPLVREATVLAGLARHDWILNPLGCGYRAGLESAMGERQGSLHVAVDISGTEIQLRMVASGLGLGLVPRSVLKTSASRDEIAVVEVADFAMRLDIWLLHLKDFGNLKRPVEVLARTLADGFANPA
jgi:DNA-binding transcriptional LysR family regulator